MTAMCCSGRLSCIGCVAGGRGGGDDVVGVCGDSIFSCVGVCSCLGECGRLGMDTGWGYGVRVVGGAVDSMCGVLTVFLL